MTALDLVSVSHDDLTRCPGSVLELHLRLVLDLDLPSNVLSLTPPLTDEGVSLHFYLVTQVTPGPDPASTLDLHTRIHSVRGLRS